MSRSLSDLHPKPQVHPPHQTVYEFVTCHGQIASRLSTENISISHRTDSALSRCFWLSCSETTTNERKSAVFTFPSWMLRVRSPSPAPLFLSKIAKSDRLASRKHDRPAKRPARAVDSCSSQLSAFRDDTRDGF